MQAKKLINYIINKLEINKNKNNYKKYKKHEKITKKSKNAKKSVFGGA